MKLLDELMVPVPPYKARPGLAVLVASGEDPDLDKSQEQGPEKLNEVAKEVTSDLLSAAMPKGISQEQRERIAALRQQMADEVEVIRRGALADVDGLTRVVLEPLQEEQDSGAPSPTPVPATPKKPEPQKLTDLQAERAFLQAQIEKLLALPKNKQNTSRLQMLQRQLVDYDKYLKPVPSPRPSRPVRPPQDGAPLSSLQEERDSAQRALEKSLAVNGRRRDEREIAKRQRLVQQYDEFLKASPQPINNALAEPIEVEPEADPVQGTAKETVKQYAAPEVSSETVFDGVRSIKELKARVSELGEKMRGKKGSDPKESARQLNRLIDAVMDAAEKAKTFDDKQLMNLMKEVPSENGLKSVLESIIVEKYKFAKVQTFDELNKLLQKTGTVVGSRGITYQADGILANITDARDELREANGQMSPAVRYIVGDIPRAQGIRDAVERLLAQEATKYAVPPVPPVSAPAPAAPAAPTPPATPPAPAQAAPPQQPPPPTAPPAPTQPPAIAQAGRYPLETPRMGWVEGWMRRLNLGDRPANALGIAEMYFHESWRSRAQASLNVVRGNMAIENKKIKDLEKKIKDRQRWIDAGAVQDKGWVFGKDRKLTKTVNEISGWERDIARSQKLIGKYEVQAQSASRMQTRWERRRNVVIDEYNSRVDAHVGQVVAHMDLIGSQQKMLAERIATQESLYQELQNQLRQLVARRMDPLMVQQLTARLARLDAQVKADTVQAAHMQASANNMARASSFWQGRASEMTRLRNRADTKGAPASQTPTQELARGVRPQESAARAPKPAKLEPATPVVAEPTDPALELVADNDRVRPASELVQGWNRLFATERPIDPALAARLEQMIIGLNAPLNKRTFVVALEALWPNSRQYTDAYVQQVLRP